MFVWGWGETLMSLPHFWVQKPFVAPCSEEGSGMSLDVACESSLTWTLQGHIDIPVHA